MSRSAQELLGYHCRLQDKLQEQEGKTQHLEVVTSGWRAGLIS